MTSDAAIGQTAHEACFSHVGLVDFQSETGRQQHAKRDNHAHEPALLVRGLQHDHRQRDIGAILGDDALNKRALFALGAGRVVAADLPVPVHRPHRALGGGKVGGADQRAGQCGNQHLMNGSSPYALVENAHGQFLTGRRAG